MVSLGFNVVGQLLSATDGVFLANSSVNVLLFRCTFDDAWTGFERYALFRSGKDAFKVAPSINGEYYDFLVPSDVLNGNGFYFTLVGVVGEGDVVVNRLTTNKVYIRLAESGYTDDVKATFTPIEKTVKIIWSDNDDSKGLRPEYVTGWLNKDSVPYKGIVLSEGVGWEHTDELTDTGTGTTVFAYALEVLDDYAQSSNVTGDLTTVTYTILPSSTVKVVWVDDDDSRGLRPESVTVAFKADNVTSKYVTLNSGNGWEHTETGLDPTKTYTWQNPGVNGYIGSSSVSGDLTTITYTIRPTQEETRVWKK